MPSKTLLDLLDCHNDPDRRWEAYNELYRLVHEEGHLLDEEDLLALRDLSLTPIQERAQAELNLRALAPDDIVVRLLDRYHHGPHKLQTLSRLHRLVREESRRLSTTNLMKLQDLQVERDENACPLEAPEVRQEALAELLRREGALTAPVVEGEHLAASLLSDTGAASPRAHRFQLRWLAAADFAFLGRETLAKLALLRVDEEPETHEVIARARQELDRRGGKPPSREDHEGELLYYGCPDGHEPCVTEDRIRLGQQWLPGSDLAGFTLAPIGSPHWLGWADRACFVLVFPVAWPLVLVFWLLRRMGWRKPWPFDLAIPGLIAVLAVVGVLTRGLWLVGPVFVVAALSSIWLVLRAGAPDLWRVAEPCPRLTLYRHSGRRLIWTGRLHNPAALAAALKRVLAESSPDLLS